jgi:DNA-binding beta-propeller fold protein YncE
MSYRSWVFTLPLIVGLAAAAPVAAQQGESPLPVWPPPPEVERIRWVGSLSSERQLGRKESFFARLKRSIAGTRVGGSYAISRPYDVFAPDSSRIYVSDGVTPAIILFDRASRQVHFLGEDVPGGLAKPMGLGGDAGGHLYVADQVGRRVVVFDEHGRFVRTFGGRDVLLNPVDVAVDVEAGRYYVVDSYLHQVVVFDSTGEVVGRIGRTAADLSRQPPGPTVGTHQELTPGGGSEAASDASFPGHPAGSRPHRAQTRDLLDNRGNGNAEFRYPVAATVAADGTLWIVDQLNFRIQAFDRQGTFLRSFGQLGSTPGSFARPKGISVDSEGHVYVSDAAFNNLQVFDPDGRLLLTVCSGGPKAGELQLPMGLTVDRNDRIYVADRYNNRIATLQYLAQSGPASPPAATKP